MTTTEIRFALLGLALEIADLGACLAILDVDETSPDATPEDVARSLQGARIAARLLERKARDISSAIHLPRPGIDLR